MKSYKNELIQANWPYKAQLWGSWGMIKVSEPLYPIVRPHNGVYAVRKFLILSVPKICMDIIGKGACLL